jgi:uncharacterized protein (TIRG00374 family)
MGEIPLTENTPIYWYVPSAILLSIIFLYLAFRGVSWNEFTKQLLNCQGKYLIFAIGINLVNFVVRSQRWGILLRGKGRVRASTLFWAFGVGYLGNNFLPFRSGEVIRSVTLGQKSGINKVYVFATAITERIIDAIFLILLGLLLIPTIGKAPSWLSPAMRGLGILSFATIVFLLMAPRLEKYIISILNHIPLPVKWRPPVIHVFEQFLQGAASFQNPGRAGLFLLMTCGIWLLDGIGMIFSARAFSIEFHLSQSLLLLVGLGLSSAIPSSPGYIGVYQFVAVTILSIFGYPQSQALAFILVAQAIGMLLSLVWGLIGLWRLGLEPNELGTTDTER